MSPITRWSYIALSPLAVACHNADTPNAPLPAAPAAKVEVAPAKEHSGADHYVATATVRGLTTAVLTSRAMGYVKQLHVHAGDDVKEGQLLVELDARDAKASIAQARAAVAQAQASISRAQGDVKAAQARREIAEQTWKRIENLASQRATTDQHIDEARSTLASARAQEQIADAALPGTQYLPQKPAARGLRDGGLGRGH